MSIGQRCRSKFLSSYTVVCCVVLVNLAIESLTSYASVNPSIPCETISTDFIGGMQMTRRMHDYLFVVVDKFNKMCVLNSGKKTIKSHEAAELFFANVWVHFGLPTLIVSDRESRFLGTFWTTLWERMDAKLKHSILYSFQCPESKHKWWTKSWCSCRGTTIRSICRLGMSSWFIYNMLITVQYILPSINPLLRLVSVIFHHYLLMLLMEVVYGQQKEKAPKMHKDAIRARSFINRIRQIHWHVQEQLEQSQVKYKLSWPTSDRS